MRIRLEEIREKPFEWRETREVGVEEVDHPDVEAIGPVHWQGRLSFADPGYLLVAAYRYEQTLTCNRCLGSVTEKVDDRFELLLQPADEPVEEGEIELGEEDLGIVPVSGETVELEPLLIEQIQLNVPMKPLCSADCAGLCPSCGANLDEGSCSCSTGEVDPRWEALAAMKGRLGAS